MCSRRVPPSGDRPRRAGRVKGTRARGMSSPALGCRSAMPPAPMTRPPRRARRPGRGNPGGPSPCPDMPTEDGERDRASGVQDRIPRLPTENGPDRRQTPPSLAAKSVRAAQRHWPAPRGTIPSRDLGLSRSQVTERALVLPRPDHRAGHGGLKPEGASLGN